jgi:hypothetical protein
LSPSQTVERRRYADGGFAPAPRGPWWVELTRSATATVRELRGNEQQQPGRWGIGPDGAPVFVPAPTRKRKTARLAGFAWRNRRTLAPIPVAFAYMILNSVDVGAGRPLVAAALAAPAFAAALWLTILGGADRTRATLTILAVTVCALEAWWLTPDGVAPPGAALAIGAAAAGASSYRFRIREAPMPTARSGVPVEVARWDELVAAYAVPTPDGRTRAGLLPGSRAYYLRTIFPPVDDDEILEGEIIDESDEIVIEQPAPKPIGFQLAIELVPGVQEVATLRGKLGLIAGIYGADRQSMVVDEVGDETKLKLTITHRKFLNEVKIYKRPTLDTAFGRFVMQTLGDGSPGYWQLWMPHQGVRHGWIIGATNGGKSGAVDLLLANAMSCGVTVLDLVDLKGGASIPHWEHRAFRYGTTFEAGVAALRRGVMMCDYRNDLMRKMPAVDPDTGEPVMIDGERAYGRTWVDPSPEWPIYLVLIEEWPQLVKDPKLGPLALALAARIASLGRQASVMLVVTSQGANLDEAFGGIRVLRTNIQAGNVLVLWTDQGSGNLATATRTIDLSKIPAGQPGVSFLVGPGQLRDLQGRVAHVRRPFDAVQAAVRGELDEWSTVIVDAADAFSETGDAKLAAQLALARFTDPEWAAVVDKMFGATGDVQQTASASAALSATGEVAWSGDLELGDGQLGPRTATGPADPHGDRPEGQRVILRELAAGERTAAQLRSALGDVTDQGMRAHLNPLLDGKLVERTGRGVYRLAGTETTDQKGTT